MSLIFTAFRALPLLWQLGVVAAIGVSAAGAYGLWHHKVYLAGEAANQAKIDRQNQGAKDATDRARARVDQCFDAGGVWNDGTGQCDRP